MSCDKHRTGEVHSRDTYTHGVSFLSAKVVGQRESKAYTSIHPRREAATVKPMSGGRGLAYVYKTRAAAQREGHIDGEVNLEDK